MLTLKRQKMNKLVALLRNHCDGPIINVDTIFMVLTVALILGMLYVETSKAETLNELKIKDSVSISSKQEPIEKQLQLIPKH